MNYIGNKYKEALIAKYQAQRSEALANLELYFSSPVGIGEHSDLLTEFDRWIKQLADAESYLESIEKYFGGKLDEDSQKKMIKS